MRITAEDTRHALLAYTSLEDGYINLQKVILNDEWLSINEKIQGLTMLQRVYTSLKAKAV